MKPEEARAMTDADLDEAVENARQELFNLRFQHATGRLADTSRLGIVRRELARLFTIKREREIWAEYQAAGSEEE
jgi:large subunit ribosomal protein L29